MNINNADEKDVEPSPDTRATATCHPEAKPTEGYWANTMSVQVLAEMSVPALENVIELVEAERCPAGAAAFLTFMGGDLARKHGVDREDALKLVAKGWDFQPDRVWDCPRC